MLPPNALSGPPLDPRQRRLLKHYRALSESDRHALLRYAQFLADQLPSAHPETPQDAAAIPEPSFESAPEGESVIAAIRRLSRVYFMIDKDRMLHETTSLMTQHVMQGRSAQEVIGELETLFAAHYQTLIDAAAASKPTP